MSRCVRLWRWEEASALSLRFPLVLDWRPQMLFSSDHLKAWGEPPAQPFTGLCEGASAAEYSTLRSGFWAR